ncbi:MAG: hypothetical protein FJW37_00295 [Acidobacteria bacterium]|nr:hypothetical protein [Acidobacteriota bacterium]
MSRFLVCFLLAAAAFGQYRIESGAQPPAGLAPEMAALLQSGIQVIGPGGAVFAEIWFRAAAPKGVKTSEEGVAFPEVPHGALLGAIRFPGPGADRRGQTLRPGVYTLRFSLHPINGDHLGVAPQRDFLVLAPAAEDRDAGATPAFEALMDMSRKVSGTPHPAVLSLSSASGDTFPRLEKEGGHDWVLMAKIGDLPVALIVIGKAEG